MSAVELTQALVRTPSSNPPGDERACAAIVRDALADAGLGACEVIASDATRPNLLLTLDFGPGGRELLLAGHLDTKPVGDATWTADPFGAEIDGDRLHGLGSADMKSGVAAIVEATRRLAADPPPAGRLTLLFTADEEDGAAFGARHVCATAALRADGAAIAEPGGIDADFDRLHLVSRGIARTRMVATAPQGHSSLSAALRLPNAGVAVARAVTALADAGPLAAPADPHGLEGWEATVNPGLRVTGGVGFGVLPGRMAADVEVRVLPGMTAPEVHEQLTATAGDGVVLEEDAWLDATAVDPAGVLAGAARDAFAAVLGAAPPDAVFPGTTDATFLAGAGIPTLPATGPGLLRRTHAADEWVSVAAIERCVELHVDLARRFCAA